LGLAGDLFGADVPFLLPLVLHERVTPSGKLRSTERPLFPSYLFLSGDEFDRSNAMATGRLVGAIPIFDVPGLIRDLSHLLDAIESGAAIGPSESPRPGSRCRVVSGPLEGKVGTFVREAHRDLLLLYVHILGRVTPVEIESHRVELIEGDDHDD
jgi:transcription antitermination factor NusG